MCSFYCNVLNVLNNLWSTTEATYFLEYHSEGWPKNKNKNLTGVFAMILLLKKILFILKIKLLCLTTGDVWHYSSYMKDIMV